MTACATETAPGHQGEERSEGRDEAEAARHPQCTLTADGSYAARLATDGESFYPERWTLDGPEPYAVPLPGNQPEEPGTALQPLADGRVLIHRTTRLTAGEHHFALLYPTGPGTGELPLGTVESERLRLLPPTPHGRAAYALAVRDESTDLWLVAGGARGPELVAAVPGRCSGGAWLDGAGRMLALDRERDGRTKTVVVDLQRGGEVSPLLQISEESEDRLLLADIDSGLLLLCSDAPSPGRTRLGWGVLGSTLPVRFPHSLRLTGRTVTPLAVQPGQTLTPETAAVALRIDGPTGTRLGVWRPLDRKVRQLAPPQGWLTGSAVWTRGGLLRLPCVTDTVPCAVAEVPGPEAEWDSVPGAGAGARTDNRTDAGPDTDARPDAECRSAQLRTESTDITPSTANSPAAAPIPLGKAPLGPVAASR
ncbi:hypothetical protein [Streptomyces sp. NA04227]|uniref:hypothetical protein n=1 Tax=Streptomyces sp. NA04227 TaxID=2742136 RepID=UPI0020CA9C28|nr:hypothetical protein [Streptomyces sp. NA04227]